jgi:hypothetical protein
MSARAWSLASGAFERRGITTRRLSRSLTTAAATLTIGLAGNVARAQAVEAPMPPAQEPTPAQTEPTPAPVAEPPPPAAYAPPAVPPPAGLRVAPLEALPKRGRFCLKAGIGALITSEYGVPVRYAEIPVGIGGCFDGLHGGFEAYGTASVGFGATNAGRNATSWSIFGAELVVRHEVVRGLIGFGTRAYSFGSAPGLGTGPGSSAVQLDWTLGVGVDLRRLFDPDESARIRSSYTLDAVVRGMNASGHDLMYGLLLGAHM